MVAFLGMDQLVDRTELEEGLAQDDRGSDPFFEGTAWAVRRGLTKANVSGKAARVTTIVGLQTVNGDYTVALTSGANLDSEASFDA